MSGLGDIAAGITGGASRLGQAITGGAQQLSPQAEFASRMQDPNFAAQFNQAADNGYFGEPAWMKQIDSEMMTFGNNTPQYDSAYNQAMQASRSNITQAMGNALSEIANRQNIANQGLATLPGTINQNFTAAQTSENNASQQMAAAEQNAGLHSFLPQGAEMQPGLQAIANANAGAQSQVPILKMGLDTAFSNQRQQTQASYQDKLDSLDQTIADHNASYSASQQDKLSSIRENLIAQHFQQEGQDAKTAQANAAKYAAQQTKTAAQMTPGYSGKNGQAIVKNLPDVAAATRAAGGRTQQAYQETIAALQNFHNQYGDRSAAAKVGKAAQWDAAEKKVEAALQKKYPNQSSAINIAYYDVGF